MNIRYMNRNSQQLLQQGLLFLFVILLILFSWNVIQSMMKESFAMEPIPSIDLLPTPPITINQSMFKPIKYQSITIPPMIK
jgi:TRAP-type C4-dicarboxylate transport system permease small subunit